jgi:hypothetical protein
MAKIYAHPTLMQNRHSLAQLVKVTGLLLVARPTKGRLPSIARPIVSLERPDPNWPGGNAA